MKSAIILGGGPAGSECALWLTLLGHDVVILEKTHRLGGLQAISPYKNDWMVGIQDKSGETIANDIHEHIKDLKIPVIFDSSVSRISYTEQFVSIQNKEESLQAQYLVIATGVRPKRDILVASEHVLIGPGEKIFNYSFQDKRVAILGGGDNAAENYAFIQEKSPKYCHIYARNIKARSNLMAQVNKQDLYHGSYEIDQAYMSVLFANERREYDVLIVLYGFEANLSCAFNPHKPQILSANGYIETDASCRTKIPRFFAIGEVANRMHPCVITAMADGVVAAKAIQRELEGCHPERSEGSYR